MNPEDKKLHDMFFKIFELEMEKNPVLATYFGYKHEKYDHLLPNGSLKEAENSISRIIKQKETLKSEIEYSSLSEEGKLDFDLIEHFLNLELFNSSELGLWRSGATASGPVGNIASAIYLLFSREYAPLETRVKAIINRLKNTPQYLEETKETWLYPVKLWTEMALEEIPRSIGFLNLIKQILEPQLNDELNQELAHVINIVSQSFEDYGTWIEQYIKPRATHDWVIGTQKFSRLVELRRIGKTPEEILEIGYKLLEETNDMIQKLAEKLYPDKTVEEIRELIKSDHPLTFEMVLEHVKELTEEAKEFIIKNDLMDVPEEEDLKVAPTPSFLIPILPFAAYMPPEKFSTHQMGEYIVTPIEGNENMLKEHSYASCKNTAVHEAYPGHHLQIASANLQPNLIRTIVQGDETVEGWAHYCEQLMAEKGFLGDHEIFIQLIDQLWRAVRIIVDVKIHQGKMSFEEAKELMITKIGMEESAVIAELKRYTATPSYQFSYLLGKVLLLELREEIKEKLGNKYSDRFFHNTILHNGGLPIHFLRRLFDIKIKNSEIT